MNTADIGRLMSDIPDYVGTFSCDTLPPPPSGDARQRLMIVNTDPPNEPGEHWVATYIDSTGRRKEYFDSFGRQPPAIFETYMNYNCSDYCSYNKKQLQSIASRVCGYYCI